jgi:predicted DNA-binding protein
MPTPVFTIRLPLEIKEALRHAADAEHRTMATQVLACLEPWLREHGYLDDKRSGSSRRTRRAKRGGRT